MFNEMPMIRIIVLIVSGVGWWLSALNGIATLPLLFNFSIIPGIEKKTEKKLTYSKFYNSLPTGKYGRYMEISLYIGICYLRSRWGKDNLAVKKNSPGWALSVINYPVEQFSRREIFWSFFALTNTVMFFVLGSINYFLY